jgi:hypothetical protein
MPCTTSAPASTPRTPASSQPGRGRQSLSVKARISPVAAAVPARRAATAPIPAVRTTRTGRPAAASASASAAEPSVEPSSTITTSNER